MKTTQRLLCIACAALALATLTIQNTKAQGRIGTQNRSTGRGYVPGVRLTPRQQRQIAGIRLRTRVEMRSERRNHHHNFRERQRQIIIIRRNGHTRIIEILTPEQRNQFHSWWNDRSYDQYYRYRTRTRIDGRIPGIRLSAYQQRQITRIRQDTRQRMLETNRDTSLTNRGRQQRIAEISREEHDEILEILTPDQRAQLDTWWQDRNGR